MIVEEDHENEQYNVGVSAKIGLYSDGKCHRAGGRECCTPPGRRD
jgi:hypothetical protein